MPANLQTAAGRTSAATTPSQGVSALSFPVPVSSTSSWPPCSGRGFTTEALSLAAAYHGLLQLSARGDPFAPNNTEQSRSTGRVGCGLASWTRLCSLRWRSQQRELAGTSERLVGAETQAGRWSSSISLRDLRCPKPKFLNDAGDKGAPQWQITVLRSVSVIPDETDNPQNPGPKGPVAYGVDPSLTATSHRLRFRYWRPRASLATAPALGVA